MFHQHLIYWIYSIYSTEFTIMILTRMKQDDQGGQSDLINWGNGWNYIQWIVYEYVDSMLSTLISSNHVYNIMLIIHVIFSDIFLSDDRSWQTGLWELWQNKKKKLTMLNQANKQGLATMITITITSLNNYD